MFTTRLQSTSAIYYAKASLGLEGSGDAYVSSYLSLFARSKFGEPEYGQIGKSPLLNEWIDEGK